MTKASPPNDERQSDVELFLSLRWQLLGLAMVRRASAVLVEESRAARLERARLVTASGEAFSAPKEA